MAARHDYPCLMFIGILGAIIDQTLRADNHDRQHARMMGKVVRTRDASRGRRLGCFCRAYTNEPSSGLRSNSKLATRHDHPSLMLVRIFGAIIDQVLRINNHSAALNDSVVYKPISCFELCFELGAKIKRRAKRSRTRKTSRFDG
ncbi:hypothetical protein CPC16_003496 [Podila verticillata]|nr:hypothetical protein CPC16_003496 [Podila verticillata]